MNVNTIQHISIAKEISIGDAAFANFLALQTASFPKAKTIGAFAFRNCTTLQTASFPKVTDIGFLAFRDCTSLQTLKLGANQPTTVAANAFNGISSPKYLHFVAADGSPLSGLALSTAQSNYGNPWHSWTTVSITPDTNNILYVNTNVARRKSRWF